MVFFVLTSLLSKDLASADSFDISTPKNVMNALRQGELSAFFFFFLEHRAFGANCGYCSFHQAQKNPQKNSPRYLELLAPHAECFSGDIECRRTTLFVSSGLPSAYLRRDTPSHAAWAGPGPPPGPACPFCCVNSSV